MVWKCWRFRGLKWIVWFKVIGGCICIIFMLWLIFLLVVWSLLVFLILFCMLVRWIIIVIVFGVLFWDWSFKFLGWRIILMWLLFWCSMVLWFNWWYLWRWVLFMIWVFRVSCCDFVIFKWFSELGKYCNFFYKFLW